MATYLCVKAGNQTKSYAVKSTANKPYLKVSSGYIPLTTETTTATGLRAKVDGSTYRPIETYTTAIDTTTTIEESKSTGTTSDASSANVNGTRSVACIESVKTVVKDGIAYAVISISTNANFMRTGIMLQKGTVKIGVVDTNNVKWTGDYCNTKHPVYSFSKSLSVLSKSSNIVILSNAGISEIIYQTSPGALSTLRVSAMSKTSTIINGYATSSSSMNSNGSSIYSYGTFKEKATYSGIVTRTLLSNYKVSGLMSMSITSYVPEQTYSNQTIISTTTTMQTTSEG